MHRDYVNEAFVLTLARASGIEVPADDLELLTRAVKRYTELAAELERTQVDEHEPDPSLDPRVGW